MDEFCNQPPSEARPVVIPQVIDIYILVVHKVQENLDKPEPEDETQHQRNECTDVCRSVRLSLKLVDNIWYSIRYSKQQEYLHEKPEVFFCVRPSV